MFSSSVTLTLLLASMLGPIQSRVISDNCDDISIRDRSLYKKEFLVKLDASPVNIAVDHYSGSIYIVDTAAKIYILSKHENKTKLIPIAGVKSVAIDNSPNRVFVGTTTGLKIYDESTGIITESVPGLKGNVPVYALFVAKDTSNIYVTTNTGDVYKYLSIPSNGEDLHVKIIGSTTLRFVVDFEQNYYYNTNENSRIITNILYKNQFKPIKYAGDFDVTFANLAVDSNGRVYGTAYRGLFYLNPENSIPQLITTMDFEPQCMHFDENDHLIIGTNDNKLVMLKPNDACFLSSKSLEMQIKEIWKILNKLPTIDSTLDENMVTMEIDNYVNNTNINSKPQ